MKGKFEDLTGRTFGDLEVIGKVYSTHYGWYYRCKCICGEIRVVRGSNLTTRHTSSCGCKNNHANMHKRIYGVK